IEPVPMHRRNARYELRESAREALVRWGLQELLSYTLTSRDAERALQASHPERATAPRYVEIVNTTTSERTVMRRTLLPGVLQAMIALAQRTFEADKLPRFPGIDFDISAAVGKDVPARDICRVAREVGGEHLREVTVFDIYVGPQVGADRKAVGLRGTLLAED